MSKPANLTDQPLQSGPVPQSLDRPLIHDLMPPNDQLNSRLPAADANIARSASANPDAFAASRPEGAPTWQASVKQSGQGDFLDIPPLQFAAAGAGTGTGTGTGTGKGIAHPVDTGDKKAAAAPDPFKLGGDHLVQTASGLVGQDLTIAPHGSNVGAIPKKFGCAAALSNVMIKGGQMNAKDFSASVDGLEKVLKGKDHATVVDAAHLQPGDIVVGRNERDGSGGRHVGIVDRGPDGKLVAFNNNVGNFTSSDLKTRFLDRYRQVYGLRLPAN